MVASYMAKRSLRTYIRVFKPKNFCNRHQSIQDLVTYPSYKFKQLKRMALIPCRIERTAPPKKNRSAVYPDFDETN